MNEATATMIMTVVIAIMWVASLALIFLSLKKISDEEAEKKKSELKLKGLEIEKEIDTLDLDAVVKRVNDDKS